jgi:hypothetical protein
MRRGARVAQRLADEQPARAGLDRDVDFLAGETPDPLANSLGRGADAASLDLPRLIVESVERDLRPIHVKPGYDRHQGPPLKLRSSPIRASVSR